MALRLSTGGGGSHQITVEQPVVEGRWTDWTDGHESEGRSFHRCHCLAEDIRNRSICPICSLNGHPHGMHIPPPWPTKVPVRGSSATSSTDLFLEPEEVLLRL